MIPKLLTRFIKKPSLQPTQPPSTKPEPIASNYKCTRQSKNTYEAAFYLTKGAKLTKVRRIKLPSKKALKKGFYDQWVMTLADVPVRSVEHWRLGQAQTNVQDLQAARRRLKREIKRLLY